MKKTFAHSRPVFGTDASPVDGNTRGILKKLSPPKGKGVFTLRIEKPFSARPIEDGSCRWCSKIAPQKLVNTNQGVLSLCKDCILKATRAYEAMVKPKISAR